MKTTITFSLLILSVVITFSAGVTVKYTAEGVNITFRNVQQVQPCKRCTLKYMRINYIRDNGVTNNFHTMNGSYTIEP